MSGIDELIATFTARQYGLIARWQALDAGISPAALDYRIASGELIVVHSGVYRLRGVPYTQELRWLAAVLAAGPDSWLSHRAGAALHGFEIRHPKPEVSVVHGRDCDLAGIITHRTRRDRDVIVVNKIPVTTKARTLLDCAAVMPFSAFEALLQNAVTGGLVRIEPLLAIADRRGGRGVAGTVPFRAALAGGLVDEKIQRRLELIVARIIATARVPAPVRQLELICRDGRRVVLDNAWPDRKIAVEPAGERWHGNAYQARKSRERSRSIVATGWQHYVYGWSEATEAPDAVRREIESFWEESTPQVPVDSSQNRGTAA